MRADHVNPIQNKALGTLFAISLIFALLFAAIFSSNNLQNIDPTSVATTSYLVNQPTYQHSNTPTKTTPMTIKQHATMQTISSRHHPVAQLKLPLKSKHPLTTTLTPNHPAYLQRSFLLNTALPAHLTAPDTIGFSHAIGEKININSQWSKLPSQQYVAPNSDAYSVDISYNF